MIFLSWFLHLLHLSLRVCSLAVGAGCLFLLFLQFERVHPELGSKEVELTAKRLPCSILRHFPVVTILDFEHVQAAHSKECKGQNHSSPQVILH